MAIIDWDNVQLEIPYLKAGRLFIELLEKADHERFHVVVRDHITPELRANVSSIVDGLECELDAAGVARTIKHLILAIHDHARLSRSRLSWVGTEPGPIYITWQGTRTSARVVTVSFDPGLSMARVAFQTGTGKPSRFLEPFCHLAIAQLARDIGDAEGYYLDNL